MTVTARSTAALVLAAGLLMAACGGDGRAAPNTAGEDVAVYGAQVASYDLAADGPQRFLVGLIGADSGQ